MKADRHLLSSAVGNLLQNAIKFTHPGTELTLAAYATDNRIEIDVADHCGGLPDKTLEELTPPFIQASANKNGLGLGLSIVRRNVEAIDGILRVRNHPGVGCTFTIDLPRHAIES